jgi:hypothetical protein
VSFASGFSLLTRLPFLATIGREEECEMEEPMAAPPVPRTAAEYRAAIDVMIAELRRMHARMDANGEEFDRLRQETCHIQAETEEIKARVRCGLADILTWT